MSHISHALMWSGDKTQRHEPYRKSRNDECESYFVELQSILGGDQVLRWACGATRGIKGRAECVVP